MNMNFVAMDFETANHQAHSACSLALVMVQNSQIVDEYYTYPPGRCQKCAQVS